MDQQFPFRSTFFRGLPLTIEAQQNYELKARENALALIQLAFNEQWRYVPPEKDGIQLRKDTSNMITSYRLVRSSVILKCTSYELGHVLRHTQTDSLRSFLRKFLSKSFVDAMTLHNIQLNATSDKNSTPEKSADIDAQEGNLDEDGNQLSDSGETSDTNLAFPASANSAANNDQQSDVLKLKTDLVTVKWGVVDVGLNFKRDMCVLDMMGESLLPNSVEKETLNMWCLSSIDGSGVGCMSLKDTHGVARSEISKFGLFWHQIANDDLEVVFCGSFRSKYAKNISVAILASVNRLQDIVEDLRLSYQQFAHRSLWVKDCERTGCHLCMRNFHTWRRKHHCRMCGEVICSDCSILKIVDLPVIGISKLRLCKICCIRAKSTPVENVENNQGVFNSKSRARNDGSTGSLTSTTVSTAVGNNSCSGSKVVVPTSGNQQTHSFDLTLEGLLSTPSSHKSDDTASDIDEDYDENASIQNSYGDTIRSSLPRCSSYQMSTTDEFHKQEMIKLRQKFAAMHQNQSSPNTHNSNNSAFSTAAKNSTNMFDLLCDLACQALNCPISAVCLIDTNREYIKSTSGLENNRQLMNEINTFVDRIMGTVPIVILDASSDRHALDVFQMVPNIKFFAGCPIFHRNGSKIGYICVGDTKKRTSLGSSCAFTMERLATLAVTTMEERREMMARQSQIIPKDSSLQYSIDNAYQTSNKHSKQASWNAKRTYSNPNAVAPGPSNNNYNNAAYYSHASGGGQDSSHSATEEKMRDLLFKSYLTQQQLASNSPTTDQFNNAQ